jgi:hypothetical protein
MAAVTGKEYESKDLLPAVLELARALGKPYCVENVETKGVSALMRNPVTLCSAMFQGLPRLGYRHRLFEVNFPVTLPKHLAHKEPVAKAGRPPRAGERFNPVGNFPNLHLGQEVMGMGWGTKKAVANAIPPLYSQFLFCEWLKSQTLFPASQSPALAGDTPQTAEVLAGGDLLVGGMPLQAVSLQQPWAWAIFHAGKDVENRSWATDFRGQLAVHASKKYDREGHAWMEARGFKVPDNLPRGCLVGVIELLDCVREASSPWAIAGQNHLVVGNPVEWKPIPYRGQLGIFSIELPVKPELIELRKHKQLWLPEAGEIDSSPQSAKPDCEPKPCGTEGFGQAKTERKPEPYPCWLTPAQLEQAEALKALDFVFLGSSEEESAYTEECARVGEWTFFVAPGGVALDAEIGGALYGLSIECQSGYGEEGFFFQQLESAVAALEAVIASQQVRQGEQLSLALAPPALPEQLLPEPALFPVGRRVAVSLKSGKRVGVIASAPCQPEGLSCFVVTVRLDGGGTRNCPLDTLELLPEGAGGGEKSRAEESSTLLQDWARELEGARSRESVLQIAEQFKKLCGESYESRKKELWASLGEEEQVRIRGLLAVPAGQPRREEGMPAAQSASSGQLKEAGGAPPAPPLPPEFSWLQEGARVQEWVTHDCFRHGVVVRAPAVECRQVGFREGKEEFIFVWRVRVHWDFGKEEEREPLYLNPSEEPAPASAEPAPRELRDAVRGAFLRLEWGHETWRSWLAAEFGAQGVFDLEPEQLKEAAEKLETLLAQPAPEQNRLSSTADTVSTDKEAEPAPASVESAPVSVALVRLQKQLSKFEKLAAVAARQGCRRCAGKWAVKALYLEGKIQLELERLQAGLSRELYHLPVPERRAA